jgi:pilus assembly protein CpaB
MRRGGPILLILVLIIVILIAFAFLLLARPGLIPLGPPPTPTQAPQKIIVAGQPINKDAEITDAVLTTQDMPKNLVTEKMITNKELVIGKFAVASIPQGWPLSVDMVSDRPSGGGSKVIQPGQVAISIPINRLDSVAYGVRDGDYVDVIATTLFVDLDASFQTIIPNSIAQLVNLGSKPDEAPLVVLGMQIDGGTRTAGRAELDPTLGQALYYIPSEAQRPRLVSQMILQDVQVLHIGTFATAAEESASQQPTPAATTAAAGQPTPAAAKAVKPPDIITLIVSPQDAVSLNYLLYSGTKLTLVLRAPDDRSRAETEAATLQYILSQYAIPIPAKLPYGIEPRVDRLVSPVLSNDAAPTPRP